MKYLEQWLSSDFTIGFELEGYTSSRDLVYDTAKDFFPGGISIYGTDTIKDDGSLDSYYDDFEDSFEYTSKIFKLNMENLQRIIKFLDFLINKNIIITDSTCGFHVHIGFPEKFMQSAQQFWVLLNLIFEPEAKQLVNILSQGDIKFYTDQEGDDGYASFAFILKVKKNLESYLFKSALTKEGINKQEIINELSRIYSSDKYRFLRLHPQGTLEWRGPRGFMEEGKRSEIKTFFLQKLFPFVYWMTKALDNESLNIQGYNINRDDIIKTMYNINPISKTEKRTNELFDNSLTRENITDFLRKFPQYAPNKLKYTNMNMTILKDFPVFINGNFTNGFIENALIYGGGYRDVAFHNCVFINGGMFSADIEQSSYLNDCLINDCNIKNSDVMFTRCAIVNLSSDLKVNSNEGMFDSCSISKSIISNTVIKNNTIVDTDIVNAKLYGGNKMFKCNLRNISLNNSNNFDNCVIKSSALDRSNDSSDFLDCVIENSTITNCNFVRCHASSQTENRATKCKFNKSSILNYGIDTCILNESSFKLKNINYEMFRKHLDRFYNKVLWIDSKFFIDENEQDFLPDGSSKEKNSRKRIVNLYALKEATKDKLLFIKRAYYMYVLTSNYKWDIVNKKTCNTCKGSGNIVSNTLCPTCLGVGFYNEDVQLRKIERDDFDEYKRYKHKIIDAVVLYGIPIILMEEDQFYNSISYSRKVDAEKYYAKMMEELDKMKG